MKLAPLLLASALLWTGGLPTHAAEELSDGRIRMGTILEVQLEGVAAPRARALVEQIYAEVAREEKIFSRFDPGSALSALNARAGTGPVDVPAPLARLLFESRTLSELSGGTFDVSVGPLIRLWDEAGELGRAPARQRLADARRRVGSAHLSVDLARSRAALERGSAIDLGGVAKGFALDRCGELLRAEPDLTGALLSFGQSSLYAHGSAGGGEPWRIALHDASGGFAGVIELRDTSLSVSESLGQYVQIGAQRYGHVIDPRSGRPLERAALAAVVTASGTRAEALSKALLILGPRDGIALLERLPGVEGMLADAAGRLWFTRGFRASTRFARWQAAAQPPYATR